MEIEEVAAIVGDTLSWAQSQASMPVITDIVAVDIGEVELTMINGERFRLIVEAIGQDAV